MIQPNIKTYNRVIAYYIPMPIRTKLARVSKPKTCLKELNTYGRNHINFKPKEGFSRDIVLNNL